MSFESLKLDASLLRAIEASGFKQPTDIQVQAIPVILDGQDLMASAQTGTGKTAAFVLPLLQKLLTQPRVTRGPRVMVLTPTRELAAQVEQNIRQFSQFIQLKSAMVVGGEAYPPQIKALQRPLDLLVATPGRLMDHMERGRIDFSELQCLVLDEADRMLDMGFVDEVKMIAKATPASRQTLLFSATLDGNVGRIAREILKNPQKIALAHSTQQHASIVQQMYIADDKSHKERLLGHFLDNTGLFQALVFTSTKRGADDLAQRLLAKGHEAAALHGDMQQRARQRTMERMRSGQFRVLVATDVAARGLDIKGISHVFNFDLPMTAEDYVHRIGRTGRGGAEGTAISLVGPDDLRKLSGIEKYTGSVIKREVIVGLEPTRTLRSAPPAGKFNKHRKPQQRFSENRGGPRRGNDSSAAKPARGLSSRPQGRGKPTTARVS